MIAIGVAGLMLMGYYNRQTTGNALLLPHLLNERVYSPLPLFLWQKPKSDMTFHDRCFREVLSGYGTGVRVRKDKIILGIFDIETFASVHQLVLLLRRGVVLACADRYPVRLQAATIPNRDSCRCFDGDCSRVVYLHHVPLRRAPDRDGLHFCVRRTALSLGPPSRRRTSVCGRGVCRRGRYSLVRQTGSAAVNSAFALPDTRTLVARQLETLPGKHLVLVTYDLDRHYPGDELVHNWADFSSQKILWARSKGPGNDSDLCGGYSDRTLAERDHRRRELLFAPAYALQLFYVSAHRSVTRFKPRLW